MIVANERVLAALTGEISTIHSLKLINWYLAYHAA